MLATKTTCRDRWRQVINEADRIPVKHLLTLQEGVSEAQFREMTQANVQLVVPEPLIVKFPAAIRTDIMTLESFLGDLRILHQAKWSVSDSGLFSAGSGGARCAAGLSPSDDAGRGLGRIRCAVPIPSRPSAR